MNNTTTLTACASIPFLFTTADIYLIGMLLVALIGLIPTIYSMISAIKTKNEDKLKQSTKDLQEDLRDTLETIKKEDSE